eukprot:Hpha_TRINITY_DN3546_c0_g1::TRINITY_DN3546_c0_g1_i1::g.25720::m.25720
MSFRDDHAGGVVTPLVLQPRLTPLLKPQSRVSTGHKSDGVGTPPSPVQPVSPTSPSRNIYALVRSPVSEIAFDIPDSAREKTSTLRRLVKGAADDPSGAWKNERGRRASRRATLLVERLQEHTASAMQEMASHQHAILSSLRAGNLDSALLKQPEYRAKEQAYQGACRAQSEADDARRVHLKHGSAIPMKLAGFHPPDPLVAPPPPVVTGHRCYRDIRSYEAAQRERASRSAALLLQPNAAQLPSKTVAEERLNDIRRKRPGNRYRGVLDLLECKKGTAAVPKVDPAILEKDIGPLYTAEEGGVTGEVVSREALLEKFKEADTDGSGQVSTVELITYLRKQDELLGIPHNAADTERLLQYTGGVGSRWRDPARLRARLPGSTPDELPPTAVQAMNPLPPVPQMLSFDEFCAVMLARAAR